MPEENSSEKRNKKEGSIQMLFHNLQNLIRGFPAEMASAATWMGLEMTTPSQVSQTQKDK